MIEANHSDLSISRQCDLLGLSRSSYYYQPCGESVANLVLMKAIDVLYTKHPFYGPRRIAINLPNIYQPINVKKVRRLMKLMGIEAIYPKPDLSKPDSEHKIFPYLLRGKKIEKVNQVWSTDITYIPMEQGFLYLSGPPVRCYCRLVFSLYFILGTIEYPDDRFLLKSFK